MKKTGYFLFLLVLQISAFLNASNAIAAEKSLSLSHKIVEQSVSTPQSQAPEMETVSAPASGNFSAAKGLQKIPTIRSAELNSVPLRSILFTQFDTAQGCLYSAKKYLTHNYPFHNFW